MSEKPTIEVGAIRVAQPDGTVLLRSYIRGMGASTQPYPLDPDEDTDTEGAQA